MEKKDFHCIIEVNVSPEEAIQKIEQVNLWWASNVQGATKNLNDVFTVRFGKTFSTIQVTEMIPGKKMLWSILNSSLPLFKDETVWNGTKILWEISSANNTTAISMTHLGLTPEKECYEDCNKGWRFYAGQSLRKLITEGEGLPGTGIFANISNGNRRYGGLLYFKNDPLPNYAENFFFVDVKETSGETITRIFSAAKYNKETFNARELKGDYFMIIEDTALYNSLSPLDDISATINLNN